MAAGNNSTVLSSIKQIATLIYPAWQLMLSDDDGEQSPESGIQALSSLVSRAG